ncbi:MULTISPECIES: SDR family oxidoreductase [Actinoalloteichus]|uniref:Short-chain alcohol dehydrogenase n=1 Tax=Actinoalloteichus fjordicus TaxID=1612552 RepID=A0AAC9LJQ8_9PSEU|nr:MULTISPECIES: SDR family oxidoreductase [Actinoalloteichus]APU17979.1 short-chain alcohol dehydrogenase [Actinoalloteichus fjordicus]APU24058.1 short-chain alcohol dehydrogenase [Actinoalloteichus sp. GBA129-24]
MTSRPLALVTGASRGVGAAVARALAPTHDLLLGGRDPQTLLPLVEELPTASPWAVELTDEQAVAAATADVERLDVLVHSAGVVELGSVAETSAASWRRTLEVNVVAVAELTRLLLPALRAARGHVVLINSGAGLRAGPGWGSYAASKFALRAFADVLRAEEAESGIRVTSVHPGRVATDMQREVRAAEGGDFEPERYLRPQTVADVVATAVRLPADGQINELVLRPRS